ncbi:MAG TPA: sigma-70 family RNA polymerase sigma factor [Myxococcota bacterium]
MEDAPLIARVIAHDDRHAFTTLVRRHQSSVRAFLLRLSCGDAALADDVAQEVFLNAYRRIATYRSEGGFASWLFSIAYRAFASEKRKRRWSAEEFRNPPEGEDDAAHETAALAGDVALAMRHLREPERACLSLCYQWGLSHQEAASVLDCPVGTVKTHIARGKEKLREHLSAYGPQRETRR